MYRDSGNRAHTWHIQRYGRVSFKKTESWNWQVHYSDIREHQGKNLEIDVDETEMDEMWSFVHDKSQQYWLWWAIHHHTGEPSAYCFGTREHKFFDELLGLLAPFHIKTVYADDNFAYKNRVKESVLITGKRNTQKIERKHLSLFQNRLFCHRLQQFAGL